MSAIGQIDRQTFRLANIDVRRRAWEAIKAAPDFSLVTVGPPKRTLDQNAKFHALCEDVAKSGIEWFGKPRSAADWKILLISAHASETGHGCDMVQGLNGEFVQLRESSARMSKERASSLLEYSIAWAVSHGVKLQDGGP